MNWEVSSQINSRFWSQISCEIRLGVVLEQVCIDWIQTHPHGPLGPRGLDIPGWMNDLVDIQINPEHRVCHPRDCC